MGVTRNLWILFSISLAVSAAEDAVIGTTPSNTVVKNGADADTLLLNCLVKADATFTTLTWKKGTGDAETTICTASKGADGSCTPDDTTIYKIDNENKYNLLAKNTVDYIYADSYKCEVTTEDAKFAVTPHPADVIIVDETKCPEPTIDANKDDVIKLNCTVEYSGKVPTLSIKPTTGTALETTVTSTDTDTHKTAQGTATHKFTKAGDFNYTCTTSFDGVTYVDKAPCLMTVTVKGSDTPDDNAAVGLQAPIYLGLLVGAVTFWLTRMV